MLTIQTLCGFAGKAKVNKSAAENLERVPITRTSLPLKITTILMKKWMNLQTPIKPTMTQLTPEVMTEKKLHRLPTAHTPHTFQCRTNPPSSSSSGRARPALSSFCTASWSRTCCRASLGGGRSDFSREDPGLSLGRYSWRWSWTRSLESQVSSNSFTLRGTMPQNSIVSCCRGSGALCADVRLQPLGVFPGSFGSDVTMDRGGDCPRLFEVQERLCIFSSRANSLQPSKLALPVPSSVNGAAQAVSQKTALPAAWC